MHLNLAGWHVTLDIDPPPLGAAIAQRYAPFHHPGFGEAVDLVVEIRAEAGAEASGSILNAELTTNEDKFLLDDSHFYGMIAPDQGRALLHIRSDATVRETEYFLRVALALFAFHSGGLLVHCAALKVDARAYLFIGQSGSGKSTVVSLSTAGRRATALGDDLILLRQEDQDWWAYGTPFWNLETKDRQGQTDSGPIRTIYKLIQSPNVFVAPMSPGAATAELAANCPIVNCQPTLLPGLLDRCRDLVKTVNVQQLHFRRDDSFWDVINGGRNSRDR